MLNRHEKALLRRRRGRRRIRRSTASAVRPPPAAAYTTPPSGRGDVKAAKIAKALTTVPGAAIQPRLKSFLLREAREFGQ